MAGDSVFEVSDAKLPKQMPDNALNAAFAAVTTATAGGMNWAVIISMLLNIWFAQMLNKIVGNVLHVQIILFESLIWFALPGNASDFFKKVRPIVTFNILRFLTDFSSFVMKFDTSQQSINGKKIVSSVQAFGIKSKIAIKNLGNFFWMQMIYFQ